jgi:hypothetical protein
MTKIVLVLSLEASAECHCGEFLDSSPVAGAVVLVEKGYDLYAALSRRTLRPCCMICFARHRAEVLGSVTGELASPLCWGERGVDVF